MQSAQELGDAAAGGAKPEPGVPGPSVVAAGAVPKMSNTN